MCGLPEPPQPAPRRGGMAVAVLEAPPQHERVPGTRHRPRGHWAGLLRLAKELSSCRGKSLSPPPHAVSTDPGWKAATL